MFDSIRARVRSIVVQGYERMHTFVGENVLLKHLRATWDLIICSMESSSDVHNVQPLCSPNLLAIVQAFDIILKFAAIALWSNILTTEMKRLTKLSMILSSVLWHMPLSHSHFPTFHQHSLCRASCLARSTENSTNSSRVHHRILKSPTSISFFFSNWTRINVTVGYLPQRDLRGDLPKNSQNQCDNKKGKSAYWAECSRDMNQTVCSTHYFQWAGEWFGEVTPRRNDHCVS